MFRQYREIKYGDYIVIGGDCSAGGTDYSCCQFVSKKYLDVPLVYHSKSISSEMTMDILPVLDKIFDITGIKPIIAYERNNGGLFEMERLANLNRQNKYTLFQMPNVGSTDIGQSVKYGWDTNSATRPEMLKELKYAIDNKLLRIYDKDTIEELLSFVVVQTSSSWKAQAEHNAHDDLVMSLAIAWQMYLYSPGLSEAQPDRVLNQPQFRYNQAGY